MSKVIKSIKLIKDLPGIPAGTLYTETFKDMFAPICNPKIQNYKVKEYPDFFEIEYEPEILKRPDGSLIAEPEDKTEIIFISEQSYKIQEFVYPSVEEGTLDYMRRYKFDQSNIWKFRLSLGLIFLPEDRHLAEKKAKMLSKQLEIQYEIDRLNAEEGWVADWKDENHKYFFVDYDEEDNTEENVYIWSTIWVKNGGQYMSKKTAKTILAKYSQGELKQYLGIII